jgi:hypothetical protein
MSKQTDFDTEGMTAEQLAAANERLAKIPGVGTETFADDEPTGFITAHADAPAPPAPARKRRADAGKPNPLRANRKASKYTLEADLFTPEGRDTLVFWIRQGYADRVIEVVDRLLVDLQELKAARDGEGA